MSRFLMIDIGAGTMDVLMSARFLAVQADGRIAVLEKCTQSLGIAAVPGFAVLDRPSALIASTGIGFRARRLPRGSVVFNHAHAESMLKDWWRHLNFHGD